MRRPPALMKACSSGSSSLRMRLNTGCSCSPVRATAMLALWAVRQAARRLTRSAGRKGESQGTVSR
jgi:hypothetical protein